MHNHKLENQQAAPKLRDVTDCVDASLADTRCPINVDDSTSNTQRPIT